MLDRLIKIICSRMKFKYGMKMKPHKLRKYVLIERSAAVIWMLIISFSVAYMIYNYYEVLTDYCAHLQILGGILLGRRPLLPHFLYQFLVFAVTAFVPIVSTRLAGTYVVPILSQILLAVTVCFVFDRLIGPPVNLRDTARRLFFICSLLILGPISLFTLHNQFLGYIHPHVYNSANIHLVKVLSILLFFLTANLLIPRKPSSFEGGKSFYSAETIVSLFCLTVLSLLAKPSYMICFLPGVFMVTIYIYWRDYVLRHDYGKPRFRIRSLTKLLIARPLVWGVFLPAVLVLGWQYFQLIVNTSYLGNASSFVFSPGGVFGLYFDYDYFKITQLFLLSVGFPMVFYFLYFRQSIRNARLNFAWLIFAIACFYLYFFNESLGAYGNFLWGAQVAVLILFIESTVAFILELQSQQLWVSVPRSRLLSAPAVKKYTCLAVYSLHVLSGIIFYARLFFPFDFLPPPHLVKWLGVPCPISF